MLERSAEQLRADTEATARMLEDWLKSVETDLVFMSRNPAVTEAAMRFAGAWSGIGAEAGPALRSAYLDASPYPVGERHKLNSSGKHPFYDGVHAEYHPYFRSVLEARGYYDIFLFDAAGNLVYSVFKEPDFATNFRTGDWAQTDLGKAYRKAAEAAPPGRRCSSTSPPTALRTMPRPASWRAH